MRKNLYRSTVATLIAIGLPAAGFSQYYGVIDNYSGISERYPALVNLTSKNGVTINTNFFFGGGAGGGGGENPDTGPLGVGDKSFTMGGAIQGGFIGLFSNFQDGSATIDFTAVSKGRSNTGVTVDFKDNQNDGDVYALRLESGGFDRSRTYTITPTDTNWNTYAFNFTDGVLNESGGAFDPTALTNIVVLPITEVGGNFDCRVDNLGFISNLVPTDGFIEDFEGYTPGNLGAGIGPLANLNQFDGVIETFAFGSGAVTDSNVVDVGGDTAVDWTFSTTEGGIVFDLGDPGAQVDISAFDALEISLAVGEAGDAVAVLVEDINAVGFGDRCSNSPAVTTTLQTFQIPLASFACGPQGLTNDAVHRVTVVPTADQSNGITITVGHVAFVDTSTSVQDWQMLDD